MTSKRKIDDTPSKEDTKKSRLEFEARPRNSIERHSDVNNKYINKAIELIMSEKPDEAKEEGIIEDIKDMPVFQKLYRINKFLYKHELANARNKLINGHYGGKTKKRKWSLKYKRSINCKKPKGFSQKQYCKRVNKTRRKK
jgi:hypothetical protein